MPDDEGSSHPERITTPEEATALLDAVLPQLQARVDAARKQHERLGVVLLWNGDNDDDSQIGVGPLASLIPMLEDIEAFREHISSFDGVWRIPVLVSTNTSFGLAEMNYFTGKGGDA